MMTCSLRNAPATNRLICSSHKTSRYYTQNPANVLQGFICPEHSLDGCILSFVKEICGGISALNQKGLQMLCAFALLQHLFQLSFLLSVKVFWLVPVVLIVSLFRML